MREGLLIAAVVLNSLILLAVVVGAGVVIWRLGKTTRAAEGALEEIRREIGPTLRATQDALKGVETLAAKTEQELDQVSDLLHSANRLLSGVAVADAAARAIRSSKFTAAGILAGIKEGLRAMKSRGGETKEGSENG